MHVRFHGVHSRAVVDGGQVANRREACGANIDDRYVTSCLGRLTKHEASEEE